MLAKGEPMQPEIDKQKMREMLLGSDLLRTIPEHEFDAVARGLRQLRFPRGSMIFQKGGEGRSVMFLAAGRVKIVSVSPDGTEVIHNIIEVGEIFGEMALLDGKPRCADAIAAIDCEVVEFSRPNFLAILERNPGVGVEMMAILCDRIRQSTAFVEDAVLLDAGTRLLNRLRALADQYGRPDSDGKTLRIEHGLSQQEIGESVGLTRVSINRLLGRWRAEGLIEDGRGYIVIRDSAFLKGSGALG